MIAHAWKHFLTLLIFSFFFQQKTFGFSFGEDVESGVIWSSLPIHIKVMDQSLDTDEAFLLNNLVDRAMESWKNESQINWWSQYSEFDISEGLNNGKQQFSGKIYWAENFLEETGFDPMITLAITIRRGVGNVFRDTEIILNGEFSGMKNNQNEILYRVILHELGHSIGLNHSNLPEAIMAPYLTTSEHLHEDDIEGAKALYEKFQNRIATGVALTDEQASQSSAAIGPGGCQLMATEQQVNFESHSDNFFEKIKNILIGPILFLVQLIICRLIYQLLLFVITFLKLSLEKN